MSEYDWEKNIKKIKSNSRDKFIIFAGCDTESKSILLILMLLSNIAGAPSTIFDCPNGAAFFNWMITKGANLVPPIFYVNELFE